MNFTGDYRVQRQSGWQAASPPVKEAAGAFVAAAAAGLFLPASWLVAAFAAMGLSPVIPGDGLPAGVPGRFVIALACGLVAAALVLVFLAVLRLRRGADNRASLADYRDLPRLRSGDAHPDAPPRRPLFAAEDLADPLPLSTWLESPEDGLLPAISPASSDEPEVIFEETGMADTVRPDAPQARIVRSLLDTDLASLPIGELVARLEHSLAALKATKPASAPEAQMRTIRRPPWSRPNLLNRKPRVKIPTKRIAGLREMGGLRKTPTIWMKP